MVRLKFKCEGLSGNWTCMGKPLVYDKLRELYIIDIKTEGNVDNYMRQLVKDGIILHRGNMSLFLTPDKLKEISWVLL